MPKTSRTRIHSDCGCRQELELPWRLELERGHGGPVCSGSPSAEPRGDRAGWLARGDLGLASRLLASRRDDDEADQGDEDGAREYEGDADFPVAAQGDHDGSEGEDEADGVQEQDGAAGGEAEIEEAVVDVAAIGTEDRLALE
jgi:hypothetical protein